MSLIIFFLNSEPVPFSPTIIFNASINKSMYLKKEVLNVYELL